jgi:hypothetical protein
MTVSVNKYHRQAGLNMLNSRECSKREASWCLDIGSSTLLSRTQTDCVTTGLRRLHDFHHRAGRDLIARRRREIGSVAGSLAKRHPVVK